MAVIFAERFSRGTYPLWQKAITGNGLIGEVNNKMMIRGGSNLLVNDLAFWGKIPKSSITLDTYVLQCEISFSELTTSAITIVTALLGTSADYADGVSILINSTGPSITMLDVGGSPVAGGDPLTAADLSETYILKFLFNADGTVTGYADFSGTSNHELGTSTDNSFSTGALYFLSGQSYIVPVDNEARIDDVFFHSEGISYDVDTFPKVLQNIYVHKKQYSNIDASSTDEAITASGRAGDLIERIIIIPATTSPGAVTIGDGDHDHFTLFAGGASSVPDLSSITLDVGMRSMFGGWRVTTGANVSVLVIGGFL